MTRILLDADKKFTLARKALVQLWEKRAEVALHEIEIKEYKADRSTQANRYYFGVVVRPLAKHLGYTEAEMHDELLGTVFGWKTIRGLGGQERKVPNRRTTEPEKMNSADFAMYIEHCQRIAAEMGVYVEPWSNAA